jgi:hypothetical protein
MVLARWAKTTHDARSTLGLEPAKPAGLFCPPGTYFWCEKPFDCKCIKGARGWRWWEKRPSTLPGAMEAEMGIAASASPETEHRRRAARVGSDLGKQGHTREQILAAIAPLIPDSCSPPGACCAACRSKPDAPSACGCVDVSSWLDA